MIGLGCSEEESEPSKDKLIGKRTEVSPCESCNTFTFSQNDSILQTFKFDATINGPFEVKIGSELEIK